MSLTLPERSIQSAGLMLVAQTRTSTSPAAGLGSSMSSYVSNDAGPYSWRTIAFMLCLDFLRNVHDRIVISNDLKSVSVALDNGQDQVRRVCGIIVDPIENLDEILY